MKKKKKRPRPKCRRCGREEAVIRRYGLYLCRQCFKEVAEDLGFKKFG